MTMRSYPTLGESLYETRLPNGLRVRMVPKKDFATKVAFLAIDFGSIDTAFSLEGKSYRLPDGIAHYLEHKMFDLPNEDPSAKFAEMGANVNAFTSYSMTAYHFSCTDRFEESLTLLLRMVATPYFTDESVEKERGIITQEIRMYEDNAYSRVSEDLFRIMFPNHPVCAPIAGTVESISQITAEMLYTCHKAFYHPSNMVLCVSGDVSWDQVLSIAEANTPKEPSPLPIRDYGQITTLPGRQESHRSMEISMPTFCIGFPCPLLAEGDRSMRREIIGELASEILVGESSPLYTRLYEDGIIDSAFSVGYESVKDACLLSVSGDSESPEIVYDAIIKEAQRLVKEGFDLNLFTRLLRSSQGRRIRSLDSFSSICYRICAYEFDNCEYFAFAQDYAAVTPKDVHDFLAEVIHREPSAIALITPKEDDI